MYVRGYAEDVDFCYRALNCGYRVMYLPHAKILHLHMATFGRIGGELIYSLGAYNNIAHFILNWSIRKLAVFLGVGVLKRDIDRRLKWLTYGLLVRIRSHGFREFMGLLARRLRRKVLKICNA